MPPAPTPIEILHWPRQEDRRQLLATLGEPRLLLLAPDTPPPPPVDHLEHWIPERADPATIVEGVTQLERKLLDADTPPALDDDGLLWFRGRWIAVPDGQLPVVDLLIQNYQRLVRNDDLSRTYHDNGGSNSPASVRTLLRRIAARLTKIGLRLHTIPRRGVILSTDEPAGLP